MKHFMVGCAIVFFSIFIQIYKQDSNLHQEKLFQLKFVSEEAAAAGNQFLDGEQYKEGKVVYNDKESIKAAEYFIKKNLKLNADFTPKSNSYWTEKITYKLELIDDLKIKRTYENGVLVKQENIVFPYLYDDLITKALSSPTVIVTVNTGKPRYRENNDPPIAIRQAAHSWKE